MGDAMTQSEVRERLRAVADGVDADLERLNRAQERLAAITASEDFLLDKSAAPWASRAHIGRRETSSTLPLSMSILTIGVLIAAYNLNDQVVRLVIVAVAAAPLLVAVGIYVVTRLYLVPLELQVQQARLYAVRELIKRDTLKARSDEGITGESSLPDVSKHTVGDPLNGP
jgi:hypothetical protein